jgi:hypothetical protein
MVSENEMITTSPKGRKDKLNGEEWDIIEWRRMFHLKPGTLKKVKRAINKRVRAAWNRRQE